MSANRLRVAFTGLAHSHPYTDAGNVLALGAEVVAVQDSDAAAARDFATRFGGSVAASAAEVIRARPDVLIATPRPQESVRLLRSLAEEGAAMPVFFNKVVAATDEQLHAWEGELARVAAPVGTASVLRFAPALKAYAAALAETEIIGIRVHAQHDNAGFQAPGRDWQDDPHAGGGTLVTVGVHAWEMIDRVLPGAVLHARSGWTRSFTGSTTRSEDVGGVSGALEVSDGRSIPVQVTISGVPGADRYAIEAFTGSGVRSIELDAGDPIEAFGFAALVRELLREAPRGRVPAPWGAARTVVVNSIRAAAAARAGEEGAA